MTAAPTRARAGRGAVQAVGHAPWVARLLDSIRTRERAWVTALLVLHAALIVWGAARNSVTFDENHHLPAGVLIDAKHDFGVSAVNPPLVKALCALPVLAMGAKLPADSAVATRIQQTVGYSFMRLNADRYHSIYFAARMVAMLFSLALAVLVWRWARRLYGVPAGVLALAIYALSPESLAHGGVVGVDVATALGYTATLYGWWGFLRTGRWSWAARATLGFVFTALVRFTVWGLLPILAIVTLLAGRYRLRGMRRRGGAVWAMLAAFVPVTLVALYAGYLGQASFAPLRAHAWQSNVMKAAAHAAPWLRSPLPNDYLGGFDWQAHESDSGSVPTYIFGRLTRDRVPYYYPVALAVKWPLAFLLLIGLRAWTRRGRARKLDREFLLLPAALFLFAGMTIVKLNAGIRYMFPLLPLLAVALGALTRTPPARARDAVALRIASWAWVLVAVLAIESAVAAPYWLSSFNVLAGGPGRGDRIVNDSNVDWGQGLIALKDEMRARGIGRVLLTYHGSEDPGVYGIDYVPYAGGNAPPGVEWIAVSSYFYRGLPQRMTTMFGISDTQVIDCSVLWTRTPDARPANCMYLYRLGPQP